MKDETMTVEQAAKTILDAISLGRFAEREFKRMLLAAGPMCKDEPESGSPAPIGAEPPPTAAALSDEAAAEQAWDEMLKACDRLHVYLTWRETSEILQSERLYVLRRFRALTAGSLTAGSPAVDRPPIDAEKTAREAYKLTWPDSEWDRDLNFNGQIRLIAHSQHVIDAVIETLAAHAASTSPATPAPPPTAEATRVGQRVPAIRLIDPSKINSTVDYLECVQDEPDAARLVCGLCSPLSERYKVFRFERAEWDAARASWHSGGGVVPI